MRGVCRSRRFFWGKTPAGRCSSHYASCTFARAHLQEESMTPECRHIKTSGGKCASPALRDQPWCYYHARQRERAAERRTSPAVPLSHELSNLEDRGAIQHAIT